MRRKVSDMIGRLTSEIPKKDALTKALRTPVIAGSSRRSQYKTGAKTMHTNRYGLANWDRWNGQVWDTRTLDYYQRSNFYIGSQRTTTLLRAAQDRRESRPIEISGPFWVTYYSVLDLGNRQVESFMLLVADLMFTCFLMRTAPTKLKTRYLESIRAMEVTEYDLSMTIKSLHYIKTIAVHSTTNPLYFKATVEKYRAVQAAPGISKDKLWAKQYRMQVKASGNHSRGLLRGPRKMGVQQGLEHTFMSSLDASTPRWAIESITSAMNILLIRLRFTLTRLWEMRPVSVKFQARSDGYRLYKDIEQADLVRNELHALKLELVGNR